MNSPIADRAAMPACPVCRGDGARVTVFRLVDAIRYFECGDCGSLFADFDAIETQEARAVRYDHRYWADELGAARARSFGASIVRCAEVFFYARTPIRHFLDIGSGPGYFLDAVSQVMPRFASMFYAVEMFPPPEGRRTTHPNFYVGDVASTPVKFDAGLCIEVIEHLRPEQLSRLIEQLATVSNPGALYYFNSGQPDYVKTEDGAYLDPMGRGHIVSYSVPALRRLFSAHGFTVTALPGRHWAFLAEFAEPRPEEGVDGLLNRLWSPHPDNISKLKDNGFGELMYTIGLEGARCYLEAASAQERTRWALSLQAQIEGRPA